MYIPISLQPTIGAAEDRGARLARRGFKLAFESALRFLGRRRFKSVWPAARPRPRPRPRPDRRRNHGPQTARMAMARGMRPWQGLRERHGRNHSRDRVDALVRTDKALDGLAPTSRSSQRSDRPRNHGPQMACTVVVGWTSLRGLVLDGQTHGRTRSHGSQTTCAAVTGRMGHVMFRLAFVLCLEGGQVEFLFYCVIFCVCSENWQIFM